MADLQGEAMIPVDEMLCDLRAVLEQFDNKPTFANFDKVQKETSRIERACEDVLYPEVTSQN